MWRSTPRSRPLAHVACFFMELQRCGIPLAGEDHPAFAIGRALGQRLGQDGTWTLGSFFGGVSGLPVDDPGFWAAFRWLATHDFFGTVNPAASPRASPDWPTTSPGQPQKCSSG